MLISGLQKMSLVDYPGKVACTVFFSGCNMRCPYCHNSELISGPVEPVMTQEEFFSFLSGRRGLLDGVCVTGGEPTLQEGLGDFLKKIKDLGFAVKLDTNGLRPDVLEALLGSGCLDYVAMDLKNCPSRYAETAGLKTVDMDNIRSSVLLLLGGGIDFELRTTLCDSLHDTQDIVEMRDFLLDVEKEAGGALVPHFYLQKFTDRDTVPYAGLKAPSDGSIAWFCAILKDVAREISVRGE